MKPWPLIALSLSVGAAAAAPNCSVTSGAKPPVVVELYTSEGCSSCPPADHWLTTHKGRDDVLALAFHVNYWDRLGWVDRFASPETTQRQYTLARSSGSGQVYTPQVVVDGRDWTSWPRLPAQPAASPVSVSLVRDGDAVSAQVAPASTAPAQLDGYWAVLEDNHMSKVRAGENAGETLHHDSVVRLYRPVPGWRASEGTRSRLEVSRGDAAYPRRVAFVVADAATQRPLQAAVLACP